MVPVSPANPEILIGKKLIRNIEADYIITKKILNNNLMKDIKISVISPVYKAKKIVPKLVKEITNSVSSITKEYEIILVEDGCPQNSWESINRKQRLKYQRD